MRASSTPRNRCAKSHRKGSNSSRSGASDCPPAYATKRPASSAARWKVRSSRSAESSLSRVGHAPPPTWRRRSRPALMSDTSFSIAAAAPAAISRSLAIQSGDDCARMSSTAWALRPADRSVPGRKCRVRPRATRSVDPLRADRNSSTNPQTIAATRGGGPPGHGLPDQRKRFVNSRTTPMTLACPRGLIG